MREYIGYRRTPHLKVYKCVLRERERERERKREEREREEGGDTARAEGKREWRDR